MTKALRVPVLAAAFLLAVTTARADDPAAVPGRTPPAAAENGPLFDAGPHDACFGDRYESDEDLETGYELTEEEILRVINGHDPGV